MNFLKTKKWIAILFSISFLLLAGCSSESQDSKTSYNEKEETVLTFIESVEKNDEEAVKDLLVNDYMAENLNEDEDSIFIIDIKDISEADDTQASYVYYKFGIKSKNKTYIDVEEGVFTLVIKDGKWLIDDFY